MTTLVKEGLLERTPKRGTFVANRSRKLTNVGIYLWQDIWRLPTAAFGRTLVSLLSEQLGAKGIKADIWIDSRSHEDRKSPWPELVQAANERRIQALLMPNTTHDERPWLSRLAVPSVEMTREDIANRVAIEPGAAECLAVEELARLKCKSVAMISPMNPNWRSTNSATQEALRGEHDFRYAARERGLTLHNSWLLHPDNIPDFAVPEADSERFGYQMMNHLLALPQRPEGLFVQHDWVARGALTAMLNSRINVPEDLKLVIYRNKEINFLCPVPAAYVEVSIAEVAGAMIEQMLSQLNGAEAAPVIVKPTITSMNESAVLNERLLTAAQV